MTILAIDDRPGDLKALADSLRAVFPQAAAVVFDSALYAVQYAFRHPKGIDLVFTAMTMRRMDGIALASSVRKASPIVEVFFVVQTENSELDEIARQHGLVVTSLSQAVTAEEIFPVNPAAESGEADPTQVPAETAQPTEAPAETAEPTAAPTEAPAETAEPTAAPQRPPRRPPSLRQRPQRPPRKRPSLRRSRRRVERPEVRRRHHWRYCFL